MVNSDDKDKIEFVRRRNILLPIAITLIIKNTSSQCGAYETPLAPPTIFQEIAGANSSSRRKDAIVEDVKFFAAIFAVGRKVLKFRAPMKDAQDVVDPEFTEREDFAKGIDTKKITYNNGTVSLLYTHSDGKVYRVELSERSRFFQPDDMAFHPQVTENFMIFVREEVRAPRKKPQEIKN